MKNPISWLYRRRFPYEPLITVEISQSRLIHNLNEFRKIAPNGCIAPVLKSNAYGHGLIEVASILEDERMHGPKSRPQIPFFAVDSYFEAVALRAKGFKTPLLILGYTRPETISQSHLKNVAFTIGSLELLQRIKNIRKKIQIHLKIDTGMHRQGLIPDEIDQTIDLVSSNTHIELEGICSHFFAASDPNPSSAEKQIHMWNPITKKFRSKFHALKYIHIAATDGMKFTGKIDANLGRLGFGIYGLADGSVYSPKLDLKPVLEMKSVVSGTKSVHTGDHIGYGGYAAEKNMTIATIPVGYFEGIDRRLGNSGSIQVGMKLVSCPIVGSISMNITTVDVSKLSKLGAGESVKIISNDPAAPNSIRKMAEICKTIPYELIVHIPAHLKRLIV